jgi:hypothetical protein
MKRSYLRWSRLGTTAILLAAFLLAACIGIATQPASAQEPACLYQICLTDDYGDGWNGGSADVFVNAIPVYSGLTLVNGLGPECHPISVKSGDEITVDYTGGGWPYENEYHIYDSDGILVRSEGTGGVEPGDVLQGELYGLCEYAPSAVPTVSQWGMIGMAIVLAAALVWSVRRRWVVSAGKS